VRTFSSGSKVANFGFAVNNRRKNQESGQWEDDPVFIDAVAWSRGESGRQLADLVEQSLHKGNQIFIEGHLQLDQWTGQDGQKRSKLKVVVDNLQFLEPRSDSGEGGMRPPRGAAARGPSRPAGNFEDSSAGYAGDAVDPRGEEEIPF
jgi:single-strand DNA-binding protein